MQTQFSLVAKLANVAQSLGYVGPLKDKDGNVTLESTEVQGKPVLMFKEKSVRVVGYSHNNEDGTSRQDFIRMIGKTDIVQLVREPENKFDPNAIQVLHEGNKVGYLPAKLALEIASDMDNGWSPWGQVAKIEESGQGVRRFEIWLFEYV